MKLPMDIDYGRYFELLKACWGRNKVLTTSYNNFAVLEDIKIRLRLPSHRK